MSARGQRVYVVVGSWSDPEVGEDWDHVHVFHARRDAERDAVAYCREKARGDLRRIGPNAWMKHAPMPSRRKRGDEPEDETAAYAAIVERTVR